MDRARHPALRGTWLGSLLRVLNPIVKLVLLSPIHWPLSRWFALLSWTGRKSGRVRTTPVCHVREGTTVWLTTGDRWWQNLQDDGRVRIRLRGRWRDARAVPVVDRDESVREHGRLFRERAFFRRLAGIAAARDGGPDTAALARAVDAGRTLVRVELPE